MAYGKYSIKLYVVMAPTLNAKPSEPNVHILGARLNNAAALILAETVLGAYVVKTFAEKGQPDKEI